MGLQILMGQTVLNKIGVENWLQFAITICVVSLIIVPTLNDPSSAAVFFLYRSLLVTITILCGIGARRSGSRISTPFLMVFALWTALSLISVAGIPGSRFDAFSIFYRHVFFISALLSLAHYSRRQSARWKGTMLAVLVAVALTHLVPDLIRMDRRVAGFSRSNPDYFGTFLLVGLAATVAITMFATITVWRIAAAICAAMLFVGIVQTTSRGAVLAAIGVVVLAGVRAGRRIPRPIWLLAVGTMVLIAVISSPTLLRKFFDRGEGDPYNYARTQIWRVSLCVISEHPMLGVGFGQFFHVSKRFNFPVEGQIARYEKHVGIAHSEYLQHLAELGIPSAVLLFSLFGYLFLLAWKRANTAPVEHRCFGEAAILTAAGVGAHGLVDNCWTVPVLASTIVVLALGDFLPLQSNAVPGRWNTWKLALAAGFTAVICIYSIVIPAGAIYHNDLGVRLYLRLKLDEAEQHHLKAIALVPDNSVFLENLSKVYIAKFDRTQNPLLLGLAVNCLKRAIAATPDAVEPYLRMEETLVRSMTGDEKQDLERHKQIIDNDLRLLSVDPYLPFPRKNLAHAYYNLGQYERAFEEMQKAVEYEPNYVPAYLQMASWYGERGATAAKQRYLETATSIVSKYRSVKPESPYESILLGRPESEWRLLD